MMIKVLYFARLKESLNYSTEDMVLPSNIKTILQLKTLLSTRGDNWATIFSGKQVVRAAINHALVDDTEVIEADDEVAFFPPVTGG